MSVVIIGERCPSCQKFRSPAAMVQHAGHRQCTDCENRHLEALNSLATGQPPKECSECGTTWEELRRGESSVTMYCHMEAGLYRFLCKACDAVYVPKRRELYGPTEFGRTNNL